MSTTVEEMNTTIKALQNGWKGVKTATSRLLREKSKLAIKLEKTEGKLAETKKAGKKSTASASASASASEASSETGSEPLTATAAAELEEMVAIIELIDLVKELP